MADRIYWSGAAIVGAQLDGVAAGGTVDTLYGSAHGATTPSGVAIDAATDRIYWADWAGNAIRTAPLAGGGTVQTLYGPGHGVIGPYGVTIDPVGRRIYWIDGQYPDARIRRASPSGGGVETLYGSAQGLAVPSRVAIDPAAGRIYWANMGDHTIRAAPVAGLAGGGGVTTLYGPAHGVEYPSAVAIDAAAGRIYWTNLWQHTISVAPMAGGGQVETLYGWTHGVRRPAAVAIDPTPPAELAAIVDAGDFPIARWFREGLSWIRERLASPADSNRRIYWSNGQITGGGDQPDPHERTVRSAPLQGGGAAETLYTQGANALAVLRAPRAAGAPVVGLGITLLENVYGGWDVGGVDSGPVLECSQGSWAPDLPGSFLYRAPHSFTYQWRLNGSDIGGATDRRYRPTGSGNYTCRVTATNRAGSAVQTSAVPYLF